MRDIDLLWNHLFDGLRGYLCLAYRTPTGFLHEYYTWPGEREAAARRASELGEQHDTFFSVRLFAEPRRKKDVPGPVQALWCDLDSPIDPVDWPDDVPWPTAIVESGRGWHCYWRLGAVIAPDEAERLVRALVERLGADAAACDSARLLRPPGTLNHKYDPPRPVMLREAVNERRPVATFRQLVATTGPGYGGRAENGHQAETLDVAKVLAGVPLGQRNQMLFRLACKLRAAGVPVEWTTRLVSEAASRCTPPWGSSSDEEPPERLVERVYRRYQPNPTLVVSNGKDEFVSPTIECGVGETNSVPATWQPVPISELGSDTTTTEWLWDGFLAKGHLTDFVGFWKSGKSTLLAALLQRMEHGGELAGRVVRPGKALVVTEEPRAKWLERRERLALGDHVHIISRPFPKRPNHAEWHAFTAYISRLVAEYSYDLVAFDSLPNLWCVTDENNAAEVISALLPLQTIAAAGCAVLFLRHPRKSDGGQATAGRGSGAIAGFADIIVEMRRYDPEQLQDTRRVLSVYSRYEPFEVVIRWNGEGEYETLGSPAAYSAEAQRERLLEALAELVTASTGELAEAAELPHSTASRRLSELEATGRVVRTGSGKRGDPYRWSLASGDDDPNGGDFFSPTNTIVVGEKKTDGNPENPHQNCEKALHTLVDHTGWSSDEPENPHQSCEKALHTCVVCGQAILQVSDQATLYCSTACKAKAYRQRRSSVDTPGRVDDDPDDEHGSVSFFSPTDALIVGEKKTDGKHHTPHRDAKNDEHGSVGFVSPTDALIAGEKKTEPNGRHSPGDSSQPVEQGVPDDIIAWGEQLLAELRAGRVQLPVVELRPGRSVVDAERFLASHCAEARLGIGAAVESLRRYRRVLERAGMGRGG